MRTTIAALLLLAAFACTAEAQVLNVAETLGRGKRAVFFSENRLYIEGDEINVVYGQYTLGLSDRLDVCLAVGQTRIYGDGQMYLAVGENWNLFTWHGWSVSAYNMISVPLERRQEASLALLNAMLIMSLRLNNHVAFYSGMNSLWPIGRAERGVFTPPSKKFNLPLGTAISWSESRWTTFMEADLGRLRSVGVGLARTF
ncbi:MAG: hypothetical protein V1856_01810 [Candidatus Liptonbacteria bacterium]